MRRIVWILVVLAATMVAAPLGTAQTSQETIPFDCDEFLVSVDPSQLREWQSGNVFHGRGLLVVLRDVGTSEELGQYCAGTVQIRANINLNLLTGVGQQWGTFRYELDAFPGSGFEGTFLEHATQNEDMPFAGEGVAKGYGELEGWQMRIDTQLLATESPIAHASGYVFQPSN